MSASFHGTAAKPKVWVKGMVDDIRQYTLIRASRMPAILTPVALMRCLGDSGPPDFYRIFYMGTTLPCASAQGAEVLDNDVDLYSFALGAQDAYFFMTPVPLTLAELRLMMMYRGGASISTVMHLLARPPRWAIKPSWLTNRQHAAACWQARVRRRQRGSLCDEPEPAVADRTDGLSTDDLKAAELASDASPASTAADSKASASSLEASTSAASSAGAADSGLRYRGSTAAAASTSPRDTKKFGADIDSKLRSAASSQSVVSRSHQPEAASTAVTRSDATVSKTAASAISRAEAASVMSMSHRGACEEDTAGWPLLRPGSLPVASGDVEEAVAPAAAPPSMFQRLKRRLSALW